MSYIARKCYNWFLFLGIFSCSSSVFSACVQGNSPSNPTMGSTVTMKVAGNAPIGTMIGRVDTTQLQAPGGTYFFYCSGTNRFLKFKITYPGVSPTESSIEGVYEIEPGIGMSIGMNEGGVTYYASPTGTDVYMGTRSAIAGIQVSVYFYKLGPLTSTVNLKATTYLNPAATLSANSGATNKPATVGFHGGPTGGGSIEVVNPTCSVSTPTLTFPIGDVPVSSLTMVGATGHEKKMTMTLNCEAGANISMTLNGTQHPDVSDKSVLSLDSQGANGVAKGVGVQFIQDGKPLALGQTSLAKVATAGSNVIDITARYYQTKTDVVPGLANTSALLQVTYQ